MTAENNHIGTATYSPEDNKLRLYPFHRLGTADYEQAKEQGFKWAPKQELFVAPAWNPDREDWLTLVCGEIEPEEMTLAERAEAKAERLRGLSRKRTKESNQFADRANEISQCFYMGQPILVGHHSERRARKAQERMHNAQSNAVKAAKLANYWDYKAEMCAAHANMKGSDRTRFNRIKTLLADLRKQQSWINFTKKRRKVWEEIKAEADAEKRNKLVEHYVGAYESHQGSYMPGDQWSVSGSAYDRLRKGEITHDEVITQALAWDDKPSVDRATRWIMHILNRLSFERDMLGDVPRFEGELTPAIIQDFCRTYGADKPKAVKTSDGYRVDVAADGWPLALPGDASDPGISGDEWRDLMQSSGHKVPDRLNKAVAKPKRTAPKKPPLINPTDADAERLQAIWNKDKEVLRITQAQYSANSGGAYTRCETVEVTEGGFKQSKSWSGILPYPEVCRVRCAFQQVIVITDKPQKPLPEECWRDVVGEARAWCRANLQACHDVIVAIRCDKTIHESFEDTWLNLRKAKWATNPCWRQVNESEELVSLFREAGIFKKAAV